MILWILENLDFKQSVSQENKTDKNNKSTNDHRQQIL